MSLKSIVMTLGIIGLASLFGGGAAHAEDAKSAPKKAEPVTVVVKEGDTLSSIADAHNTTYVRIYNANDNIAIPDVINVDQKIRIPTADEQLPDRYAEFAAAPVVATAPSQAVAAPRAQGTTAPRAAQPAAAAPVYAQNTSGNLYSYGWCTWYVKSRKPNIPNSWGNAYQWLGNAQAGGYATGPTPVAGAIGASGGHVVYVESVSGNNVNISEMAYAGGVGVVHYRTVPASSFYYIYA